MPPNQPQGNYDFIFKDQPKPKRGLGIGNLSKPVIFIIAAIILIIVIVVVGTLLGGKKAKGGTDLTAVLGQAQEINRINTLESSQISDPATLDLLTTAQSALTSEQVQLKKIATSQKINFDTKKLTDFQNKNTDSSLQAAAQNNNLNSAYLSYLKTAMTGYKNSLSSTYGNSSSSQLKAALKDAYDSTQTILASPQLN